MAGEELDVHFQRVLRLAGAVASDDQLAQRQLYEAASSLVRRLFEEIPLHQAFGMARLLRVALPFDANTLNSLVLPTLMQVGLVVSLSLSPSALGLLQALSRDREAVARHNGRAQPHARRCDKRRGRHAHVCRRD